MMTGSLYASITGEGAVPSELAAVVALPASYASGAPSASQGALGTQASPGTSGTQDAQDTPSSPASQGYQGARPIADDRSAIPTKPSSVTYEIKAKTVETVTGTSTPLKTADGTYSTSGSVTTFSVPLATGYTWSITVNMKSGGTTILSDTYTMQTQLSAGSVLSHDFYLTPLPSGKGGITLAMSADSTLEITSVVVKGLSSTDETLQLNDGVFTLSKTGVEAGVYDVTLLFKAGDRLVYFTTQAMTVFPNLTTDKWVSGGGSSPINSGNFNVTSELVQAFAQTQLFVGTSSYGTAAVGNPGTPYEPFVSLTEALSYIQSTGDSNKDYTIHVSGTQKGNFTIGSGLNDKMKTLTLCGIPDTTDDILNGDTDNDPETADGSVLTISTTVPITIKNLKITGGNASNGGGIYVTSGATVTLANGAVVAGNKATYSGSNGGGGGGGVYNAGTLFMYGSAVIGDSSVSQWATSTSDCSNYSSYGGGLYNAVGATAYLGYSATNTPLELTGGICFNYSHGGQAGAVYNKGVLKMNSGRISYNGSDGYTGGVTSDGSSSNFELSGGAISYNRTYAPDNSNLYAGGVRISSSGSRFTMTGGEISWNESNNGGGVSFIGGEVTFTGGVIKNNTAQKGSGIILQSGTLNIGGSAVVASGNDIWLDSSQHITITSTLTPPESADGVVATITPNSYSRNDALLVAGSGVTLANETGKFSVSDGAYRIGSDGKLVLGIIATGSNIATILGNITLSSGTIPITVTGPCSSSDISSLGTTLKNLKILKPNVKIELDLSGTTGLTEIPPTPFYGCTNISSVMLPESLTSIGASSFEGCDALTSVTIPSSVTRIRDCAFKECDNLETVIFENTSDSPSQLKSIGASAFSAIKIKTITIPRSVTSIGVKAFYDDSDLKTITFGAPANGSSLLSIETDVISSGFPTIVNFIGTETLKTSKLFMLDTSLTSPDVTWCYFVPVAGTTITGAVTGSSVFIDGRTVTINSMYVCDHEVTQAEYEAVMGTNPSEFSSNPADGEDQANRPVEKVSWYAALAYCNKRSIAEGFTPCYSINGSTDPTAWGTVQTTDTVTCNFNANGYRLPTEAEWEYAARGGSDWKNYTYSGSDTITDVAWYNGNSDNKTHEVKNKISNSLGLYDMSGNVFEWCWDWYADSITPTTDVTGAPSGDSRVDRGGGWGSDASWSAVSNRSSTDPNFLGRSTGFRVVRTASEIPGTDTCTVTFNSNGGTSVANQNVVSGTCAVEPTAPSKDLLYFDGWYSDPSLSTTFDFGTTITANRTLYAKWKSDFVFVEGTYFDGSATVSAGTDYASQVFIAGRELAIQNMYVCDHEVTQAEYQAVMGTNPSNSSSNPASGETQENRPVEQVSWYDALVYCNKRSIAEQLTPCYTISGITDWANFSYSSIPPSNDETWNAATCNFNANGYRLPTEAEWEYLARGGSLTGTQTKYSGSNTLTDVAWYQVNSGDMTHEVRTKVPNTLEIYDMNGNVWEWCWDRTVSDQEVTAFAITADTPSTGAGTGSCHIVRGGSYHCAEESSCFCNVYARGTFMQGGTQGYDKGFRVVRTAVNETPHTVTYDTDGGTEIASQNVWDGYYLPKPATPSKAMHKFGGWYSDASLSTLFDFSTPITSNTTLYAKWNSDFVFVEGTHFNGSATVDYGGSAASQVFIEGRSLIIPDLYVSDHEVTQGEFVAVMGTNPSSFQNGAASGEIQENRPVDKISWYDAIAYCNKLSAMEGLTPCYTISGITDWANFSYSSIPTSGNGTWNAAVCDFNADGYRLPTEAEWEYIARGGNGLTGTQYAYSGTNGGSDLTNYAWYSGNAEEKTHEVKKKAPNNLGIYDMSGNVYEWCWDYYVVIDSNTPASGPDDGGNRVIRGGDFSLESDFKVNRRNYPQIDARITGRGFRVVRSASYSFHDSVTMLPSGTNGTAGTDATYMYFGEWPQTIKDSSVMVDESKTLAMGGNTYYKGSDGNWYAKVTANPYIADDSDYTCSDGTTLENGTEYWFKVEPIKWRVVTTDFDHDGDGSTDDGKRLLLAENVLTSNVKFYLNTNSREISGDTIESNNYKYSTIRAYLNGSYESNDTQTPTYSGNGFLQRAFTGVAQTYIVPTTVDGNSDKVFILSKDEANSTYFTAENRKHDATDYAKANHANQKNGVGCWWWLRTAGNSGYVCRVYNNGNLNESNPSVNNTRGGVVPALCVE